MDLSTDCLQDHPLKKDRKLLISFKRRGNSTHVTSLRNTQDLSLITTVMLDVVAIIEELVIKRNHLNKLNQIRLFTISDSGERSTVMSERLLRKNVKKFVKNSNLRSDAGETLRLNVSRLRKTFINKIWRLSGQDPIATAALGNHSLTVSNSHYLEPPDGAEENFRLLGEIRVKELLDDVDTATNTPTGKCKDSLYGHCAPKNGVHCTEFLSCFRCKSFIVTKDDLFRLFSLYWLLVKERGIVGAKRWKRLYAHIVRIIDNDIAIQFDHQEIIEIKNEAKDNPHPYWRTLDSLEGI